MYFKISIEHIPYHIRNITVVPILVDAKQLSIMSRSLNIKDAV